MSEVTSIKAKGLDVNRLIDAPDDSGRARLLHGGVLVRAIMGYVACAGGDPRSAAAKYDLPFEQVEAALRYYRKHKRVIDARLPVLVG